MSKGITDNELREAENIKSGSSTEILKLAAQLALGRQVRKPSFGKMGSIVRKLGLFDDEKTCNTVAQNQIQNTYHGPVQVFNGPVYFGNSNQSFQQMMVKRSAELAGSISSPKRQRLEPPQGS